MKGLVLEEQKGPTLYQVDRNYDRRTWRVRAQEGGSIQFTGSFYTSQKELQKT